MRPSRSAALSGEAANIAPFQHSSALSPNTIPTHLEVHMEELEFDRPEIDALFQEFKYRTPRQQILLEAFVTVALNAINCHGSDGEEPGQPVVAPEPDPDDAPDGKVLVSVPDEGLRLTISQQFDRAFTPGWPSGQPEAKVDKVGNSLQMSIEEPRDQ
jgi:hypothetical protein